MSSNTEQLGNLSRPCRESSSARLFPRKQRELAETEADGVCWFVTRKSVAPGNHNHHPRYFSPNPVLSVETAARLSCPCWAQSERSAIQGSARDARNAGNALAAN